MFDSNIEHPVLTQFVLENIYKHLYVQAGTLNATVAVTPEPIKFSERLGLSYRPIQKGEKWGQLWDCAWFNFTGSIEAADLSDYALIIDIDGEGCVFSNDGTPLRGLTTIRSLFDAEFKLPGKIEVPLTEVSSTGTIDMWVEAGCNDLFGNFCSGTLSDACIVSIRKNVRSLYMDYFVLYNLGKQLDKTNPQYYAILYALEQAYLSLSNELTDDEVTRAREILGSQLQRTNSPDAGLRFSAIGHAHMDLAWLWPIRETRRKIGRTYSSVIANMEYYPDYKFGISQPQQLQWMKEDYPALYEKIKQKVREKRIEPQGAMWCEADMNLSGGEALVRQIVYGKMFFRDEFGCDINNLWLPDVFGFTAALPQLLKKSGVEYFLTIKLSWSMHNVFPHHNFIWRGIDGSEVLVHMPPEGNYNSYAAPQSVIAAQNNFKERGIVDEALLVYGIGDGGGGPGIEYLERLDRMKDLLGIPPVKQEFAGDFFRRLEKFRSVLKRYTGELYLERTQGTYTSQANNKKYNRLAENALMDLEFLTAMNMQENSEKAAREILWKEVLLYQFHDILPGSSIKRVYDETDVRYAEILKEIQRLTEGQLTRFKGHAPAAVNTTSFSRNEFVYHNGKWFKAEVQPFSIAPLQPLPKKLNVSGNEYLLENDILKAVFTNDGVLVSLFDKAEGRETLNGPSNRLLVYNDIFDAWDIYINYRKGTASPLTLCSREYSNDTVRAVIKSTYTCNKSTIIQQVMLYHDSDILEFKTEVDWQETEKMLRAEFDFAVKSDIVRCDIQFGNIDRYNHDNNSIEYAQFEYCAHKWIDLSENDYGVAVVNDCKYGYYARDGIISINLLRSQMAPCIDQDKGMHTFRYAVYPHKNACCQSKVYQKAYAFNRPLISGNYNEHQSILRSLPEDSIIIECIKPAEFGHAIIARLFNCQNGIVSAEIQAGFTFKEVCETDLLEENPLHLDSLKLEFKPFEIRTLKFWI